MTDINAYRALREARRRWGANGFVLENRAGEFRVGVVDGSQFKVCGIGTSFPEAFANADAYAAKQEAAREEAPKPVA